MNKTACVVRNQTLYNICCILNKGGKIPMCKMEKKIEFIFYFSRTSISTL